MEEQVTQETSPGDPDTPLSHLRIVWAATSRQSPGYSGLNDMEVYLSLM